jgi:uncharacterized protein (TIGR03437 family)
VRKGLLLSALAWFAFSTASAQTTVGWQILYQQDFEHSFAVQSQYHSLDQVNVRVPAELKGRGAVKLLLNADGKSANTVKGRIQ